MKAILISYYPVLFLIFFVVIMGIIIKDHAIKNKEREKHIESCNNIDRLMNNTPHTTNEMELVDALRGENIIYRGVEEK